MYVRKETKDVTEKDYDKLAQLAAMRINWIRLCLNQVINNTTLATEEEKLTANNLLITIDKAICETQEVYEKMSEWVKLTNEFSEVCREYSDIYNRLTLIHQDLVENRNDADEVDKLLATVGRDQMIEAKFDLRSLDIALEKKQKIESLISIKKYMRESLGFERGMEHIFDAFACIQDDFFVSAKEYHLNKSGKDYALYIRMLNRTPDKNYLARTLGAMLKSLHALNLFDSSKEIDRDVIVSSISQLEPESIESRSIHQVQVPSSHRFIACPSIKEKDQSKKAEFDSPHSMKFPFAQQLSSGSGRHDKGRDSNSPDDKNQDDLNDKNRYPYPFG